MLTFKEMLLDEFDGKPELPRLTIDQLGYLGYTIKPKPNISFKTGPVESRQKLVIHDIVDEKKKAPDFCFMYFFEDAKGVILTRPFSYYLNVAEKDPCFGQSKV